MKKMLYVTILYAILVRFFWLSEFPPGINHDDVELLLSAKTLWLFGTDAAGVPFPKSLIAGGLESGATGFPSMLLAPIIGPITLNLFTSRLIFTLINIFTGYFLFKTMRSFVKNDLLPLAIFSAFLLTPWSLVYSRYSLAAPISLLLISIGAYLFFDKSRYKNILSSIFFILSGCLYLGATALMPLLIVFFAFSKEKKILLSKNSLLLILIVWLGIFSFITLSKLTPDSVINQRSKEVTVLNLDRFSAGVNEERRTSIKFTGNNLFVNKYVHLFDEISKKYLNAFSPSLLFLSGDPKAAHNFTRDGLLLKTDLLLIPLGLIALSQLPKMLIFTLGFILIAPIGSALHIGGDSYFFRSFLLVIGFPLLSGSGLYFLRKNRIIFSLIVVLQIIFFSRFAYNYFLIDSVRQADNYVLKERVLANYMSREKKPMDILAISDLQMKNEYVFFSQNYNELFDENDKFVFLDECPADISTKTLITDFLIDCQVDKPEWEIHAQRDAGSQYFIHNGSLCSEYDVKQWRRYHLISDYKIEELTDKEFCERWIALP